MTGLSAPLHFYALLALHIAAGFIGLGSGLVAMASRKSATGWHALAGRTYLGSMLAMSASAAILTAWEPDRLTLISAAWTAYLVSSAFRAARNRAGATSVMDWLLMMAGGACTVAFIQGGLVARGSPDGEFQGMSAVAFFVFAGAAGLAAILDVIAILRPQGPFRARIGRHLWRMCAAYFLAATSLFLGQQDDVFPFMAGSPVLLAPSLLTLAFIGYWLARMRLSAQPLAARAAKS